MRNENPIMATSIVVNKDFTFRIRGYYKCDKVKKCRYLSYTKTIDELYKDIIAKNVIIHNTANQYKWYYIMLNVFGTPKDAKLQMFKKLVEKYLINAIKGKASLKYIIKLKDGRYVSSSNRNAYFLTKNESDAKHYSFFEAVYHVRKYDRPIIGPGAASMIVVQ